MGIRINFDYASDDSCMLRLWAKGVHDKEAFLHACEEALVGWDGRKVSLSGSSVLSEHWRTVPADRETKEMGVCDHVRKVSSPGKGAYPVTVLDSWLPLHAFEEKGVLMTEGEEK